MKFAYSTSLPLDFKPVSGKFCEQVPIQKYILGKVISFFMKIVEMKTSETRKPILSR